MLAAVLLACALCESCNDIKEGISSLSGRVDAIEEGQLTGLGEQISALEAELSALEASDSVQQGELESIKKRYAEIEAKLSALETATDEKVAGYRDEFLKIGDRISALESRIFPLESTVQMTYIPDYSDGVVRVDYTSESMKPVPDTLSLRFSIYPEKAVEMIENESITVSADVIYSAGSKESGATLRSSRVSADRTKNGVITFYFPASDLSTDFALRKVSGAISVNLSGSGCDSRSKYYPLKSEINPLFKTLVDNFDSDSDGAMSSEELSAITSLDISGLGLKSIDGYIARIPNLLSLDCSDNDIRKADLSSLSNLRSLNMRGNANLDTLNVNGLPLASLSLSCKVDNLVGQYIVCEGVKGVIFRASEDGVAIVHLSQKSGGVNWWGMMEWVEEIGEDWSLPTRDDWPYFHNGYSAINNALSQLGGTAMDTNSHYWTCEEVEGNPDRAYTYINYNNVIQNYSKYQTNYYGRAVKRL